MKFRLGRTLATPGALDALERCKQSPMPFICRHLNGDWGIVHDDDKKANEVALEQGARLLSAYQLSDQTKIWIITEADRSATTILLPEEY